MIGNSLFSGIVDFTSGKLTKTIGLTGTATYLSNFVTDVDPLVVPGLTAGLSVRAVPQNIIDAGTTVVGVSGSIVELSNPVGYTGSAKFYFGLTGGNYFLSNAKLVDINQIVTVNDIPDYEIGGSAGTGVKPFAVYTQATQSANNRVLKAIYLKYIVTKVLYRNLADSTFTAIITWGGDGTEESAGVTINTTASVLPLVELSPNVLIPPIIDYRSFAYTKLPEGQPFNADIIDAIDSGALGIKDVYSQYEQIVGGTTGIPYATSFNFIDGPEDQLEQIDAYIDPDSPSGVGNVIVSVKSPGKQLSVIGVPDTRTFSEGAGNTSMSIARTLSGEADKLVPGLVRVNYVFRNGTAINGTDFVGANGSVSFLSNSPSSLTFAVRMIENQIIEGSRYFFVDYSIDVAGTPRDYISSTPSGITGPTGTTVVTITDNDAQSSYNFKFNNSSQTQWEPKIGAPGSTGPFYTLPITWNALSSGTVNADSGSVTLNLLNTGTAIRGTDYAIYQSGLVSSATAWILNFTTTNPSNPIYVVPLRNPNRYNTDTTVNFSLSGPTASNSAQPAVAFPVSIGTSFGTYTFNIKEADITTTSTFSFSQSTYGNVPEGGTGTFIINRNVSPFNNYPLNVANVNYWQADNSTINLNFDTTSTAVKTTNFNTTWSVFDTQNGAVPAETLNYSGSTNTNLVNFADGEYVKYVSVKTVAIPSPATPTTQLKVNLSNPQAVIGGVNYGITGATASNFYIVDPSIWSTSTFDVSASQTSVNQPITNPLTVNLTIARTKNPQSGIVPSLIRIRYLIEPTTGSDGARPGTDYQLELPDDSIVDFDESLDNYVIPVVIPPDPDRGLDGTRKFKITIFQPSYDSPTVQNLALIVGNATASSSAQKSVIVTINDSYLPPDYNRTCYYFHGGGNQFPGTNNMTDPTVLYKLPTGGSPAFYQTSSLSEAMTAMILGNSDGNPSPTPGFPTVIKSFTIPSGQTISQAGTSVSWSYPATSVANYYYVAVPKNVAPNSNYYLQDLTAASPNLYLRSASGATRAVEKKDFTYDSKDYTLYRLGEASSTLSINYSFNTP